MRAIGIDPSSKATGLVVLEATGEKQPKLLLEESFSPPDKMTGMERYREIAIRVMTTIAEHAPDRIVIEGYSLNLKNASSVVPLVEIGGIIRLMMHLDDLRWLDPRAGELKKFVIGSGNGAKEKVMMYVLHRWGHVSKTNDTADAYGLACIGLAHANKLPGVTKEMRAVVGGLKIRSN